MYRVAKGSSELISNDRMTDEKAITFLKANPARIDLFRVYPDNWKEMLEDSTTEAEFAIDPTPEKKKVVGAKADLKKLKLKDLKEQYPDIKVDFGQSKKDFIQKILNQ